MCIAAQVSWQQLQAEKNSSVHLTLDDKQNMVYQKRNMSTEMNVLFNIYNTNEFQSTILTVPISFFLVVIEPSIQEQLEKGKIYLVQSF